MPKIRFLLALAPWIALCEMQVMLLGPGVTTPIVNNVKTVAKASHSMYITRPLSI